MTDDTGRPAVPGYNGSDLGYASLQVLVPPEDFEGRVETGPNGGAEVVFLPHQTQSCWSYVDLVHRASYAVKRLLRADQLAC
jgi:hypothetical protein